MHLSEMSTFTTILSLNYLLSSVKWSDPGHFRKA